MATIKFYQTDFVEDNACSACTICDQRCRTTLPLREIIWPSEALLQARERVTILHEGAAYSLRRTQEGALVLER